MLAYWQHNINPIIFEISPGVGPHWYGLAYVFGFVLLFLGLQYQSKKGWSPLRTTDEIIDFVTWMAVGVLVGGRLGYCLLYSFNTTVAHPLSIIGYMPGKPWQIAGMASHGGIVGAILAIVLFAWRHRIPFYALADAAALVTPLALGFGRIANFINGELWGRITTVPWAVIFPGDALRAPRHPSQLYQAVLEGFLLFAILWAIRARTTRQGVVALSFMVGYPIMRIIGECFRQPDADINYYFGFITQGQLLSAGMLAAAGVLVWLQFGRVKTPPPSVPAPPQGEKPVRS
ncbi:prolipoprotein diacylglyceryl transferase [Verrucomicrobia bacterium LW23]|nr:prolipoprotein diacylglyceryl transferase [Verrucomicrobia bacterium LW23]